MLLSVGLFVATRAWQLRDDQERMVITTREQIEKLHVSILRSMEVLHSIASLHRVEGRIDRQAFRSFVENALARQPELQALSWNPIVSAQDRESFELTARANGLKEFSIRERLPDQTWVPARIRPIHTPVYLIEPLAANREALGFDLNSSPDRRRSLELARDLGQPIATSPIHLTQDPGDKPGILVTLPIYRHDGPIPATVPDRRTRLDGFAVAVFKVVDLVGDAFSELQRKGIVASLYDASLDGELMYSTAKGPLPSTASVDIAGRRWVVAFGPAPGEKSAKTLWFSGLVLLSGLAFTSLTTQHMLGEWRRAKEIAQANAALGEEVRVRQAAEKAAAFANQAKSDFLASMSHEIRTPLNALLGYTQLLRRDARLSPEQQDLVHGITTGGQHLLGLINEILDLSKIEAGRMECHPVVFNLRALGENLATTCKPLCAQKRLSFRFEIDPGPCPSVRGDEAKLRQILINLLGNAIKFTPAGEVFLGIRPLAHGRWLFEVIDTGFGIPEEERPHIFQPFHQGSGAQHQGGTGLGLAIARSQVELLGGQLELESERGVGSRFFFTLQLESAAEEPVLHLGSPRGRLKPGFQIRALVVDDVVENQKVLGRMLSLLGCEVQFASNGAEALARTAAWQPSVVFLDLFLPDVSGTALAPQLKRLGLASASICVVMHSASAVAQHRIDSLAAGCADFLAKPLEFDRISDCLKTHLGVEFESAVETPSALPPPEIGHVTLPEGLCSRLSVAAELHSTTALKAALHDLRQLGPEAASLAEQIRQRMRSFDMEGIQRLLSRSVLAVPDAEFLPASCPTRATETSGASL